MSFAKESILAGSLSLFLPILFAGASTFIGYNSGLEILNALSLSVGVWLHTGGLSMYCVLGAYMEVQPEQMFKSSGEARFYGNFSSDYIWLIAAVLILAVIQFLVPLPLLLTSVRRSRTGKIAVESILLITHLFMGLFILTFLSSIPDEYEREGYGNVTIDPSKGHQFAYFALAYCLICVGAMTFLMWQTVGTKEIQEERPTHRERLLLGDGKEEEGEQLATEEGEKGEEIDNEEKHGSMVLTNSQTALKTENSRTNSRTRLNLRQSRAKYSSVNELMSDLGDCRCV